MPRLPYEELPAAVRDHVDAVLGSPVVRARTQPGGWSPGAAARVRCADGSRAFVKAVSSRVDPHTPELHRAEAVVVAALPPALGSPRLLGHHDEGTWVALVLEDVEGREPVLPADLPAVLAALDRLAAVPAPPGTPAVTEVLAPELQGWRTLAADPPPDLASWQRRHLDLLVELERGWPAAAAAGDRLLHLDLRTDNMLLRPDGVVVLVDWAWAARGAPLLDVVLLLVATAAEHGLDPGPLLPRTSAGRSAGPAAVDALLAAVCGRMEEHARRPPAPALPTVRAFQAAQARAGGAWLRARRGWS